MLDHVIVSGDVTAQLISAENNEKKNTIPNMLAAISPNIPLINDAQLHYIGDIHFLK